MQLYAFTPLVKSIFTLYPQQIIFHLLGHFPAQRILIVADMINIVAEPPEIPVNRAFTYAKFAGQLMTGHALAAQHFTKDTGNPVRQQRVFFGGVMSVSPASRCQEY